MKYIFFILLSVFINAQKKISGTTLSEEGRTLQNVTIINVNTNERTLSSINGFFEIQANLNDELRFIKEKYDRSSKKINVNDFSNLVYVTLMQSPIEIEEVKLNMHPTGNLIKDLSVNRSNKKNTLNDEIKNYIKLYPEEKKDLKNKIPNFGMPDMNQGQISIISIGNGGSGGILGLLTKEIFAKEKRKPNYSEVQNFHKKVKNSFYGDYFIEKGLDEFEFSSYLVYLDINYKFSEKYFNDFNTFEMEKKLKILLEEYINKK